MLLLCSVILNVVIVWAQTDPFAKATFDCSRIHLSYCCASRIRNSCTERCSSVRCVTTFTETKADKHGTETEAEAEIFSRWQPTYTEQPEGKHDGDALSWKSLTSYRITTPSVESTNIELENTPLPTLISKPDLRGFTEYPEQAQVFLVTALPLQATQQPAEIETPRSVFIEPPKKLGETLLPLKNPSTRGINAKNELRKDVEGAALSSIDENFQRPFQKLSEVLPSSEELIPKVSETRDRFEVISIKIFPHQRNLTEKNEKSGSRNNNDVAPNIDDIFGAYITALNKAERPESINNLSHVINTKNKPQTSLKTITESSTNTFKELGSNRRSESSLLKKSNCGMAPDFIPCVPIEEANKLLIRCCQSKNLPNGCLDLCRYDTSQKDIRRALDAGLCGILHVTPILQCASGGRDNTNCCRQKRVANRSGPQCEVFCRNGDGVKGLGLQHLVCSTVLNDLLTCHHAGLKKLLVS